MRDNSESIKWSILTVVIAVLVGGIIWKVSGYGINGVFLAEGFILIIIGSVVAAKNNAERIALEKREEEIKKLKAKKKKKKQEKIKVKEVKGIAYAYSGIALLIAGIVCILISKFI